MEMKFRDENTLELRKELSVLDELAISVFSIIGKYVKYAIVSGYVSILFGRSRVSDDIDAFVEKMDFPTFNKIFQDLEKAGFWFVNSSDRKELYDMLAHKMAVRIAMREKAVPNIEIKFPSEELDSLTLDNSLSVILNGKKLHTSKIEQQIAYKFYLGTDKDIEDAVYLHKIFEKNLNKKMLIFYGNSLRVTKKMEKLGVTDGQKK
jgi:hypothetical protein